MMMKGAETIVDAGVVPDWLLRRAIRRICQARLDEQESGGTRAAAARWHRLAAELDHSPIAVATEAANAQHYEVPAAFFALVLGPHLKYSCAWWPAGVTTLAEAESRMLRLTVERAQVRNADRILELGCGWGALTLYMASRFPQSRVLALSNSASQREFILARARNRGLRNVDVVTADINAFDTVEQFDRIVSVEMFEHVRNYASLFAKLHRWLADDGRLFVHVFAHHRFAYAFENRDGSDWMARHFFSGGMMPSESLFAQMQDLLRVEAQWRIDGSHYERTANAWLENMDRNAAAVDRVLADTYGAGAASRWRARWRVFFMACAEMFGYRDGTEWIVSHSRFKKRAY
jgi:cyclopropane-fatty-acyl-phospholipid synthase